MNLRILGIELRRSVAPWAGIVVLATALAFLYLVPGPWWRGTALWTAQWTSMALWTRYPLVFLWPLAVGLGALQGLRDHRSKMSELLISTPRPARHRAAALAGTTAFALVSSFALLVVLGAVRVLAGDATYTHLGWLPISLVGALALTAGAVLGMGIARTVPSALTPPALAVGAFLLTSLLRQTSDAATPTSAVPNRLSLLSPAVAEARETLLTLSAPVHLGQTIWLLGMAVTGFVLLAAATPRARLLALTPLLAGAAVALLQFPADPRATYVVDREAATLVCEGPVCVTTAQRARMEDLEAPGAEALRLLRETLGDRAPVGLRETTVPRALGDTPERSRAYVLVDFDDAAIGDAEGEELTRALVGQGIAPLCRPRSDTESGTLEEAVAQSIAAAWVLGELRPLEGTMHDPSEQAAVADPVWKQFMALPRAEQRQGITALHAAAVSCSGDPLGALTGGASR
ncbi:hypothetical protein [Streptomyces avidinii]|uniref:ABC-type multidrug transport system permease subunit n=1 Tax=Streptomyces avidinii TaxID=1895 RepID=A0ABS4LGB4_STRAV|nr:hypothetical protein [Streptomyces avidinii]MBP2041162.1 hypothetical protein [Streptomyces avidinii]GGZ04904.1 hypothetical protein GCM10010343_33630 [Streptomyces avidinii]